MEKIESSEEKIILRILDDPYEATERLSTLKEILEREFLYTGEEMKKIFSLLIKENFEPVDVKDIKKILNDLEKKLVKEINTISKASENSYKLTILLLALESIIPGSTSIFDNDELVKNDRVAICYDLAMLIVDGCRADEQKMWFDKRLKKLWFD